MLKVLTVVGARPQFVKAAAVSRAVRQQGGMREVMVHTGQHYDANMSGIFFSELDIPAPVHHLGISGGRHGAMTGRMMEGLERVMLEEEPDWVLVYGDTNSTLAGALAAAKLQIPLAHVEAGLRSFNRRMPEEINRILTDHLATLLLCPTETAICNLAAEGITHGVHQVGDVMYDATVHARDQAERRSDILDRLALEPGGYTLATVHRAENTDDPARLRAVIAHLETVAARRPVVLPLHPRTARFVREQGLSFDALRVIDPVGYLDMAALLAGCVDVHTDSGGVQKEAYFHRKPCVTLRDETEWVETIEAGWNRLWKVPDYVTPRREIADYGDGHSAERIVHLLLQTSVSGAPSLA